MSSSTFHSRLIRLITASLFSAVLAGTWDVWWHGFLGRESFWSPPHLLLYTSVIAAIATTIYGWWKTKERMWRWIAVVLVLIPASAPLDEFWHRVFGVEPVNSPLIVWSPPHLLLAFTIIGSFLFLLPLLQKDDDHTARLLFGSLALAGVLNLLLFIASPLVPTGPYALLGFWGAGVEAMMITAVFLIAQRGMRGIAPATTTAMFFLMLIAVGFSRTLNPDIAVAPHDHPPVWLSSFSVLVPAVCVDLLHNRRSWERGLLIGALYGVILYSFSSGFLEPQFQYSAQEASIAILSSLLGGIAAALLCKPLRLMRSSQIPSSS